MSNYPTPIHEKVARAQAGTLPNAICRLETCWVMMSEVQALEGYCIIMSDPTVATLNDLDEPTRMLYCRDMARVGDAILKITGAARINYETWANKDPALHTHIVPRYSDEPEDKRTLPACKGYDFDRARKFDASQDVAFVQKMRQALQPFVRES